MLRVTHTLRRYILLPNRRVKYWLLLGIAAALFTLGRLTAGSAISNAPSIIISDKDFRKKLKLSDTQYIIKSYKNSLTYAHIKHIHDTATQYNISPIVIIAKLQQEQSLINDGIEINFKRRMDRAVSYCLAYKGTCYTSGTRVCPHLGFTNQITSACIRLDELARSCQIPTEIVIGWGNDTGKITVNNAATYALYRYTPIWSAAVDGGTLCSGNILFLALFRRYKKKYQEIKQ